MRISARKACVKPHLRTRSDIKFYMSHGEEQRLQTQSFGIVAVPLS